MNIGKEFAVSKMPNIYESSFEALIKLKAIFDQGSPARNEATTRLQLIDRLFFDCLGWEKEDVVCEESLDGLYADYTFYHPRRMMIVEAKKEGEYFEIPSGLTHLEYLLKTLSRDNPNLRCAIDQVSQYCQSRGVPIGVICNGHQIVAFIATRSDGIPPLEGRAVVFPSLEFVKDHFLDLWELLSKPGIQNRKLLSRLLGDVSATLPLTLAKKIVGYPGIKQRNIFQTDLQIVAELVLEDVTRSRDLETTFLEECYCKSGAISQYSFISKKLLQARYEALFESAPPGLSATKAVEKTGVSPGFLEESLSRRPILIIGDIGVGKTMFILYLTKVNAAKIFENAVAIHIDLGTQATLTPDLRGFVLIEIYNQLRTEFGIDIEERNFVRGVYHFDLERFSKSIYSDLKQSNPEKYSEKELEFLEGRIQQKEEHLRRSLEHIAKARKKQVVIFFDNADQRQEDTQQAAFLISQEIADRWSAAVFVTLRPETYHKSLKAGAISGYHPKAFTISPPRVDEVLIKRLEFALKIARGQIAVHGFESVQIKLENLCHLLEVFIQSIIKNKDLIEFIDNICTGNVRIALDLVKSFFGSGHVDTQKIINIFKQQGEYIIPLHEFIRAVVFGDYKHYDPDRSEVANLFNISYPDPKEHFLMPIVVGYLLCSSSAKRSEGGFVDMADVYTHAQGAGFTPDQIDNVIIRACFHKLIETTTRTALTRGQDLPKSIRATTKGAYHIEKLCNIFSYIDAIVVDTPILDEGIRDSIENVELVDQRLERGRQFIKYLDMQWNTLPKSEFFFSWPKASKTVSAEIERIQLRIIQISKGDFRG